MTHSKGNLYPDITVPTPLASPPYHSPLSVIRDKIIGVSNSCFFFLPFSGEIMSNIFFIDLFISVENEFLKALCWSNPDVIRVTDAPSWAPLWLDEGSSGPVRC